MHNHLGCDLQGAPTSREGLRSFHKVGRAVRDRRSRTLWLAEGSSSLQPSAETHLMSTQLRRISVQARTLRFRCVKRCGRPSAMRLQLEEGSSSSCLACHFVARDALDLHVALPKHSLIGCQNPFRLRSCFGPAGPASQLRLRYISRSSLDIRTQQPTLHIQLKTLRLLQPSTAQLNNSPVSHGRRPSAQRSNGLARRRHDSCPNAYSKSRKQDVSTGRSSC